MKITLLVTILLSCNFLASPVTNNFKEDLVYHTDLYSDINYDYFYGPDSKVSIEVKREIAGNPKSSENVLKILLTDRDPSVWLLAEENLNKRLK